ncbi:DNA-binding protein [Herbiconiux sp. CPCC 203407]|uniref:DNA-binding protein n=2 Tax=Herbiconiux oxytropis TaxID=2970915 RepID=A0AA41XG91_9MICO|nr:R3H domain-containing nucleic acid-binding protein [Herbiconiux oxytropis]MCS5723185.1 DNA-binding protein [Herbiconiux oxytropis]MCS5725140.1 DNA-binding protein [Herbiconiux oxytropis]
MSNDVTTDESAALNGIAEGDMVVAADASGDDTGTFELSEAEDASTADAGEDEGDVAADYIEELLDICDLDGDIDIEVTDGRAYISVNASGESNLRVLSQPDTVAALQELTRLAVQTSTGEFSRLILDVGGSRERRQRELEKLVDEAVATLDGGATAAALEPMSSYERKLVHDIAAERGLTSESEGEGRDRHTVLSRG